MFFSEEKNQKTFANWAEPVRNGRRQNGEKFFAILPASSHWFGLGLWRMTQALIRPTRVEGHSATHGRRMVLEIFLAPPSKRGNALR
jgi:hypothetical protein